MMSRAHPAGLLPDDEDDRALLDNVHPPRWPNPEPGGRYNLVVVGAGTAGLVTAAIATALGAKVALVERHLMGGDCLNVGCVPSKAVIAASRAWAGVRRASEFGVGGTGGVTYDFAAAMARMRRLRARLSPIDSAHRFKAMGVDVFFGDGRFTGPDTVEVAGKTLAFVKAAICTGARAAPPPIPGLVEAGYLTNETLFTLTELPPRLAVIGAGPIGCEMGQAFARFGSEVTLFEVEGRILPREDVDAARVVAARMKKDGVQFVLGASVTRVDGRGREKIVRYEAGGRTCDIAADALLLGIGRAPNVEGLGLEAAGVAYDTTAGVRVNDRLQTTNPRIFAAGDVCFPFKFTHAADATAQLVIQNALFPHPFGLGYARTGALIVPWATYTDPEVARVGLSEAEAAAQGIPVETVTCRLDEVDRAVLDGEDEGFARVHLKKGTDTILGATVVAAHAGDLISQLTLAMKAGLGLRAIAGTIYPYPTQAEVLKKVANAWRKTTFSRSQQRILRRWFAWTR